MEKLNRFRIRHIWVNTFSGLLLCGAALALSACTLGVVQTPPPARVLLVPGDYATLQAAIDAAHDGDQINYTGPAQGQIDFEGKQITLRVNETPAPPPIPAVLEPEEPGPRRLPVKIILRQTTSSQSSSGQSVPSVPSYQLNVDAGKFFRAFLANDSGDGGYAGDQSYNGADDDYPFTSNSAIDYGYDAPGSYPYYDQGAYYAPGYIGWGQPYGTYYGGNNGYGNHGRGGHGGYPPGNGYRGGQGAYDQPLLGGFSAETIPPSGDLPSVGRRPPVGQYPGGGTGRRQYGRGGTGPGLIRGGR